MPGAPQGPAQPSNTLTLSCAIVKISVAPSDNVKQGIAVVRRTAAALRRGTACIDVAGNAQVMVLGYYCGSRAHANMIMCRRESVRVHCRRPGICPYVQGALRRRVRVPEHLQILFCFSCSRLCGCDILYLFLFSYHISLSCPCTRIDVTCQDFCLAPASDLLRGWSTWLTNLSEELV